MLITMSFAFKPKKAKHSRNPSQPSIPLPFDRLDLLETAVRR